MLRLSILTNGKTIMNVKSKRGAIRRKDAIIRQCYRDMAGGTQYGIDLPTIRMWFPERHAELMALKEVFPSLPD